jgi:hypothetical protein
VARRLGTTVDEQNPDRHTTQMIAGQPAARRWAKIRPDTSPEAAALQLIDLASAPPLADASACVG